MLFNSLSYLAFLLLSITLIWIAPINSRRFLVLTASLFFYGSWKIEFLALIVFSAFIDYIFSIKIHKYTDEKKRKALLLCSLSINIGLLIYFKYSFFIAENLYSLLNILNLSNEINPFDKVILPLGISFYTFLSISYTIDVYRRLYTPIHNFGLYLTYVMFWPHMIAGPILRACELIPQLESNGFHPTTKNLVGGIQKILFGLFLKVVLADELAPLVDAAFSQNPNQLSGIDVWTMAYAFGFQIYFDFAGYSMIAIGSAQLINVKFPENFNWPYLAKSPRDFWKRWHITLSSWIRDYLYLPLTGSKYQDKSSGGIDIERNKGGSASTAIFALFTTWFIMGLWHGANWNFAFWGIWHAACIYIYRLISARKWLANRTKLRGLIGWGITIPILMLGWIPFRADSLENSFLLLARIFDISSYTTISFRENFYLLVFSILIGMLLIHTVIYIRNRFMSTKKLILLIDSIVYAILFFTVFIFFKVSNQFIYFQF